MRSFNLVSCRFLVSEVVSSHSHRFWPLDCPERTLAPAPRFNSAGRVTLCRLARSAWPVPVPRRSYSYVKALLVYEGVDPDALYARHGGTPALFAASTGPR